MVTTIVVRELLIQGLRSLLEGQGQPFGAKMAGKLKTMVQCLSISAVLLCLWRPAVAAVAALGPRHPDLAGGRPDDLQRRRLPRRWRCPALRAAEATRCLSRRWNGSNRWSWASCRASPSSCRSPATATWSITQQAFAWLTGQTRTAASENLFFDVMLHVGTLAAIVIYYRAVVRTGAGGLLGVDRRSPPAYRRAAVIRTGLLAGGRDARRWSRCAVLQGLDRGDVREHHGGRRRVPDHGGGPARDRPAQRRRGSKGPAETTWLDALLIGIAQMFAPLPGVSRSGLTVATALALGLSRAWAVGFSLLIAVPAILGAAVFELTQGRPARSLDPRPRRPDRRGDRARRRRRLRRHHLAREDCAIGTVVVFFCIPGRSGSRRTGGGRCYRDVEFAPWSGRVAVAVVSADRFFA